MSDPKLRRQHLIGSNECFDRGQTGIKTIAAVQSQCRLWVNNCRAIQPRAQLLYPQKLPRLSFAAAAEKGQ
jgi:hypothetical protein